MGVISINKRASYWLRDNVPMFTRRSMSYEDLCERIVNDINVRRPTSILEVGGIDRPLLGKGRGYRYDGLDIESRGRCYDIYDHYIVQSVEDRIPGSYGMIVSNALLEHVPDNEKSAKAMFDALESGGFMHHYLPSKWHPYSIALRMVGPKWQKRLIAKLRPDAMGKTGYPAFFSHCSVFGMRRLLRRTGFIDIDIRPYYHGMDYFAWFTPAYIGLAMLNNVSRFFGWSVFASGFVVSARKP